MATSTIRIKKICDWCGKEFEAQKCSTRYCSKRCAEHAYKERKRQQRKKDTENLVRITNLEKLSDEIKSHEYLSVIEASKLLNLTRDGVYKLIYRGVLKAYRISSHYTINL